MVGACSEMPGLLHEAGVDNTVWPSSAAALAEKLSAMLAMAFVWAEIVDWVRIVVGIHNHVHPGREEARRAVGDGEGHSLKPLEVPEGVPERIEGQARRGAPRAFAHLPAFFGCVLLAHLNKSFSRHVANGSKHVCFSVRARPR